jgi:hypothetical protein
MKQVKELKAGDTLFERQISFFNYEAIGEDIEVEKVTPSRVYIKGIRTSFTKKSTWPLSTSTSSYPIRKIAPEEFWKALDKETKERVTLEKCYNSYLAKLSNEQLKETNTFIKSLLK